MFDMILSFVIGLVLFFGGVYVGMEGAYYDAYKIKISQSTKFINRGILFCIFALLIVNMYF